MWVLFWTEWHSDRVFSEYWIFPLSVSFIQFSHTAETPPIRINWDGKPSEYTGNPNNWIFLWKYISCGVSCVVCSVCCLCVNVYWTAATGTSGHFSTTLTEGFPCFLLSCKTYARVQLAKTGHGPHFPIFSLYCYVCSVLCIPCPVWSWKEASFTPLRRSTPNLGECLTLWQKMTSRKRSKNGEDGVTVLLPLDVNPIAVKSNIIGSFNFGCCYLQYAHSSMLFDYALFYVLESIKLYSTWLAASVV
jgi:hypothetical protein